MAGTIRAQIKLDGGQAFANDFKKAASAVSAANSELKYLDSELKKNGQSTEALSKKTEAVNKAWEAEQDTIDQLTRRIEELNSMTGVDTTEAVNQLTAELYKHKQAQNELGESVEQTGEDFGSLANDIAVAQTVLNAAKDILVEIAKKIWEVGKGAVEYNAEIESYEKTIQAFFKTAGQGSEEAARNTKELVENQKQLSAQIGIGANKLLDANKMLIASGISGEDAQKAVEGLAKSIVATGGGEEEFSRMAANLAQIQSVGKAAAADMKQFQMAGVDVYGLMAESTGKTVEELHDMDITFDMISEALAAATSEGGKFFEAVNAGADTLNGKTAQLESAWREGLGTAFEPVNTALRDKLIPAATTFVENIDWNAVGNGIAWAVEKATDFVNAVQAFKDWYDSVYGEPAQVVVDGFTASQEELNKAFVESAGNVVIFGEEMAGAMEKAKGLGNHMQMEFDGFGEEVNTSLTETAGQVKDFIINDGWDMMALGVTEMDYLAKGMDEGSDAVTLASQNTKTYALEAWADNAEAEQSGKHFVEGFATGMHNNNYLIAVEAQAVANILHDYLGFSRPDKGVLHNYETWMPDFVAGLAKGIEDSEWMLADASADLAQTITNNTITNNVSMAVYGTAGQSADDIANVVMLKIQQATNSRRAVWA